jgi:hypothetical protein
MRKFGWTKGSLDMMLREALAMRKALLSMPAVSY